MNKITEETLVYLQPRTCAALATTIKAFLAVSREGRSRPGAGVPVATLRAMELAVALLDRELNVDLQRAQLTALDASAVAELRWMSRADFEVVREIAGTCFTGVAWDREELEDFVYFESASLAIVAEVGCRVAAFVLVSLWRGEVVINHLVVLPEFRRQGIGRQLVQRALAKLTRRRRFVLADVHEDNLLGQQFLKACGFVCRGVEPTSDGEDGYRFEYRPVRERGLA
jgi:ribosomal protein S18 acetylase RimI-like enzyme